MPTDPLTGSRYPESGDAPNLWTIIQNAVFDLADNTIPRFASTAARDTAYTAYVAAGGTMANGMMCATTDTGGGIWHRRGGAWVLVLSDTGWTNLTPNSPFSASTGGARYRVKNNICYFQFDIIRGTSSWTDPINVFTFPSGARPAYSHYFFALRQGVSAEAVENLTIASNGVVTLGVGGAVNDHIYSSGSFPID